MPAVAPTLALLPIKRSSAAITKGSWNIYSNYPKASPAVLLMSFAAQRCKDADKTQKIGLVQLQVVGAKMPSVVGQHV
jgi:hypothetical protein